MHGRHRAPLGAGRLECCATERRFHGLEVAIPDPPDGRHQRAAHAFQQSRLRHPTTGPLRRRVLRRPAAPRTRRDSRQSRVDLRVPDKATSPLRPARAPGRSPAERCAGPPRPKAECSGPTLHRRADAPRSIHHRAAALDRGRRSETAMLARISSGPPCCTSSPLALAASRASRARAAACSWSPSSNAASP